MIMPTICPKNSNTVQVYTATAKPNADQHPAAYLRHRQIRSYFEIDVVG